LLAARGFSGARRTWPEPAPQQVIDGDKFMAGKQIEASPVSFFGTKTWVQRVPASIFDAFSINSLASS
jgi:hypothetical protein